MFVAPFKTASSWGVAARLYAEAIKTQQVNLHLVDLYMGGGVIDDWTEKTKPFNKKLPSYDYLIQMSLPPLMYKDYRFKKCVGITMLESIPNRESRQLNYLRQMDHIMFPSKAELDTPLKNKSSIGIPIDMAPCNEEYGDVGVNFKRNKDTFVFYTICDDNERKNLETIIRSYFIAYSVYDNVNLLIKTTKNVDNIINRVKKTIRHKNDFSYPTISVITDRLSDYQINELHVNCDCYVNASFGEAWCIPAADALKFGNLLFYPEGTGIETFAAGQTGAIMYRSFSSNCNIRNPLGDHIYTADEFWVTPDELALTNTMRLARGFERKKANFENYSFEAVGKRMVECLE
jgi:hypothetical protein